jgi:hypothetical protein
MSASPRIVTMGDNVFARDSKPGDILMLDDSGCPVWGDAQSADFIDPDSASPADVVRALIACGLMKSE